MLGKRTKYVSRDFTAAREEREMRMKSDVRQYARGVTQQEFLSVGWFKVAETVNQIARIAELEADSPSSAEAGASEAGPGPSYGSQVRHGRKDDGTLWDQAQDESAIRTLLEEGKLNLCLRTLFDYKDAHNKPNFEDKLKEACSKNELSIEAAQKCCRNLEAGLGSLLHMAIQHVEAMQIVDVPLLVNHCRATLLFSMAQPEPKDPIPVKCEEARVFSYLRAIMEHADELDEDRMVELIQDSKCMYLAVTVARKSYKCLPRNSLVDLGIFLAKLMESEAFQTDSSKIVNADAKESCVFLKDTVFKPFIRDDDAFKRATRQLVRTVSQWEMQLELDAASGRS